MADAPTTCGICGVEAAPRLIQRCLRCDTAFHLNPYSNVEGIDCGDAVMNTADDGFGVDYYCNPCIGAVNDEIVEATAAQVRLDAVERRPGWRA